MTTGARRSTRQPEEDQQRLLGAYTRCHRYGAVAGDGASIRSGFDWQLPPLVCGITLDVPRAQLAVGDELTTPASTPSSGTYASMETRLYCVYQKFSIM